MINLVNDKIWEDILNEVDLDNICIYLKPVVNTFGAAGTASKIAQVSNCMIIEEDDYILEGNNLGLSRFWLEIVALVPGYIIRDADGSSKLKIYHKEEFQSSYEDYIHIPIGCVTGYAIDKFEFALAKEEGYEDLMSELAITFDSISQILSDLWFVIAHGVLSNIISNYTRYILEDKKKILYYLDDIYYKQGYQNTKIEKAVIRLLSSAVKDYLGKELEEIVYETWRSDLFEPSGLVTTDESGYKKRNQMLVKEGFRKLYERGFDLAEDVPYYVKRVNI